MRSSNEIRKELYNMLGTYPDFPHKGVVFKDIFPILADEEATYNLVEELISTIPKDVTCIVAPESRGFILGSLVAYVGQYKFVPIRKPNKLPGDTISIAYKTEYSVDQLELRKGSVTDETCYFIDDIYATGGTYEAVKDLIHHDNGIIRGGTVLLDVLGKAPSDIVELLKGD